MKTKGRTIRVALIAMMISLAMTMGTFACDDYYELGGYDAYEGPEAYDDYWYDECDWEDECDWGEEDFYDDYDYWNDPVYLTDLGYDIETRSCGHLLSHSDLTEYARVDDDMFEFTVLPEKVGSTNATISAYVRNHSGQKVTSVGCTVYYSFGEVFKSTLLSCDCDYSDFTVTFDLNDYLDEELTHGGIYDYKIFVVSENQPYTHDPERFETNTVDDKIEISKELCSVTATTASVDVTVYNPTGMEIDEIGCKIGEYSWESSRDKVTGNFTDEEISNTFTLNFPDGEFVSGKTYSYEVYVVAGGKTYTTGVENFKPY